MDQRADPAVRVARVGHLVRVRDRVGQLVRYWLGSPIPNPIAREGLSLALSRGQATSPTRSYAVTVHGRGVKELSCSATLRCSSQSRASLARGRGRARVRVRVRVRVRSRVRVRVRLGPRARVRVALP